MDMKALHAEYAETCDLFQVEMSIQGFHDYIAKVKGKHAEVKIGGGEEGGTGENEDEEMEEEEGDGEATKKRKPKSAMEARVLKACHEEFGMPRVVHTLISERMC